VTHHTRLTTTIAAGFVVAVTLLSAAQAAATSLTVKNGSALELHGVYLSATAQGAWGDDLLDGTIIAPDGVWSADGVSCNGTVVVIAEDAGGCFLSQSIACGPSAVWTITNSTPRDCGR